MKLFAEHNEEYALRVGVNRSATSYYHYTNTYRHLATFLKDKYHLSDMPVKQLDENFIEDFDMYMRTVKRFMPKTILGHVNVAGVLDLRHTELLSLLSQSFTTSEAVATGKKLRLSESTVKRFLREGAREFIRKEAHGRYCKF